MGRFLSLSIYEVILLIASVAAFVPTHHFGRASKGLSKLLMAASEGGCVESCAKDAAVLAGRIMLEGRKKMVGNLEEGVVSKMGSRDIVTEYDTLCQTKIYEEIKSRFPEHAFLGEEDVEPGRDAATEAIRKLSLEDHLWIVDPIDGTTNFAHNMPLAGVIIAYCVKGECMFGLIYDPFADEMFTAWRGKGAFLNGKSISVDSISELKNAVLCTGSPPNIDSLNGCLKASLALSSQCRTVRILGSAAINLAWVACGRLSCYFETDMNVWDVAAGSLLVEEAGGKVTDVYGSPYKLETRSYVCSNGKIHSELQSKLLDAGMVMPAGSA